MLTTTELIDLIQLERLSEDSFLGQSSYMGSSNVFGGQVVSQALYAAYQTVPNNRLCNSLHAYFLLPGDLQKPIEFKVTNLRDGGSFSTRYVVASQENIPIFIQICSFQSQHIGYDHQPPFPTVKSPEELISWSDITTQFGDFLPQSIKKFLTAERPIEFKPLELYNPFEKLDREPTSQIWMKFKDVPQKLSIPTIQQLVAYASDYNLLSTAIQPHASKAHLGNTKLASLDHSIWFHRNADLSDWLLIDAVSPSASSTRGFTTANIFNATGEMICSLSQEGLMRPMP